MYPLNLFFIVQWGGGWLFYCGKDLYFKVKGAVITFRPNILGDLVKSTSWHSFVLRYNFIWTRDRGFLLSI